MKKQSKRRKMKKQQGNITLSKDVIYLLGDQTIQELIDEVKKDFENRQNVRRKLELQWQLNMNFVLGNQYCDIAPNGQIEDREKRFYWQERQVFNHLAPILETRLAKLNRVRPKMSVMPATDTDSDIYAAKLSTLLLNSAYQKNELDKIIFEATVWSETCGTVFYKLGWDASGGRQVGDADDKPVFEGDISITVVPPFEIYPDYLTACEIEDCQSLIHAQAMTTKTIQEIWGVEVAGEQVNIFNNTPPLSPQDMAIVIERYEKPSSKFPEGRLIIIAQDKLLHLGELELRIGADYTLSYPFVKQTCTKAAGSFFGISIIERAIPVQRAYNAVKNRKHEFLNRIAMGVLAVEDGAVDTDELTEEGLPPGKIVVYRQGSNPPVFMDTGRLPAELNYEEDRLMNEFISISGVSEIMRNSQVPSSISSGVGLQLLIEQDDTRLSMTAEFIREAVKSIAKMILRLYKQFVTETRLLKAAGENGELETYYWRDNDITSDDVAFATENELNQTPANKRNFVFDLLKTGLLADENGKISNHMRHKILEMLGLGIWEGAKDIESLHIKKAKKENQALLRQEVNPSEIDDHDLHIQEHIKFMLCDEFKKASQEIEKRFLTHIRQHKEIAKIDNEENIQ
ncbi:MAG TPA: hypothetical protein GX745_00640 [Clostridiales bacterium]|nr:hypothetical protein [Clostridiales bacterium]